LSSPKLSREAGVNNPLPRLNLSKVERDNEFTLNASRSPTKSPPAQEWESQLAVLSQNSRFNSFLSFFSFCAFFAFKFFLCSDFFSDWLRSSFSVCLSAASPRARRHDRTIEQLTEALQEREEEVLIAAQIGKALLQENSQLVMQLERLKKQVLEFAPFFFSLALLSLLFSRAYQGFFFFLRRALLALTWRKEQHWSPFIQKMSR
jgi:hypothetical protein